VNIISRLNGRTYKVTGLPQGLMSCVMAVAGIFSAMAHDMRKMIQFFRTGQYAPLRPLIVVSAITVILFSLL